MVLLEIDVDGIGPVECECNAPGTVHVHRVACRLEATQRVEVESGHIELRRRSGDVQSIKAHQNASMK